MGVDFKIWEYLYWGPGIESLEAKAIWAVSNQYRVLYFTSVILVFLSLQSDFLSEKHVAKFLVIFSYWILMHGLSLHAQNRYTNVQFSLYYPQILINMFINSFI